MQLFPGSPSPLPVLTGTGPGGLILAVIWTWFTPLPLSLAAHPTTFGSSVGHMFLITMPGTAALHSSAVCPE